MRRIETAACNPEELRLLVKRVALDDVEVSEAVARRTEAVFGKRLSPEEAVRQIIADVEAHGDAAVIDYAERIDGVKLVPERFFVDDEEVAKARRLVEPEAARAIRTACERVRRFHEAQVQRSWWIEGPHGEILGQRVQPLERVACYVPGGRARLLSSAVMTAIPAKVAGVPEVVLTTPCRPDGSIDPYVLVAAVEAGADRILRIGGAQAIAALAYGTTWIPKVDKIVGPGNVFVTLAKKAVFGRVGIDALHGPSEVVVVADEHADPAWVAADLLSQAEHDPEAAAILLATGGEVADRALAEIERQLQAMERREVAKESLERWGMAIVCRSLDEALEWVNVIAPEHVQLMVQDPWSALSKVRHAGAVFLGPWSAVPFGDYIAGANHVLPTNGTARFSSTLGVYDFVRRTSVVALTEEAARAIGEEGRRLALLEGLPGHADAMGRRLD